MKIKRILMTLAALCLMVPMTAMAQSQNVTIQGDHSKLAGVLQTPDGKTSYPLVLLLHGFTGDKENAVIADTANKLEKMGIASLRIDFNGHGQSEGDFQDMTVPNEIEDAKRAFAYARALPAVTDIAIAGHSQGGVVTSMVAGELGEEQVKCIVLMAPAAVLKEDARRGVLFGVSYNPENPPEYVEIFGGHKVGRNYIQTAIDLPIYETAVQYQGPACIIHGKSDSIVPYTYAEVYNYIYINSELHLLSGQDHSFTQNVDQATDIAANYLAKQLL